RMATIGRLGRKRKTRPRGPERRGMTMATVTERAGGAQAPTDQKAADLERVRRTGVVAIMRHTEASLAIEAAEALLRGGVDVVEVTMNTAGATGMISQLVQHFGDRMLVGAGTVLSTGAVRQALDAGARFVVAPNTDPKV